AAFTAGLALTRGGPALARILRYDRATALFHARFYEAAGDAAADLVEDYYDHLGIDPEDVLAKNPPEILALLQDTPTKEDDLKHLADSLDLYAMAQQKLGQPSGFARLQAMKFYSMAGASRSAVQNGQDVVDEFIVHGLIEDA